MRSASPGSGRVRGVAAGRGAGATNRLLPSSNRGTSLESSAPAPARPARSSPQRARQAQVVGLPQEPGRAQVTVRAAAPETEPATGWQAPREREQGRVPAAASAEAAPRAPAEGRQPAAGGARAGRRSRRRRRPGSRGERRGHRALRLPTARALRSASPSSYLSAAFHLEWAEVRQRGAVPVGGEDRHGEPVRRDGAGERDLAGGRCPDDPRVAERDVDAAMLTAGIGVVADGEAAEHFALRGPAPGHCAGGRDQRPDDRQPDGQSQSSCPLGQHGSTVATAHRRRQGKLQSCYREAR